jgi:hypothetical protein
MPRLTLCQPAFDEMTRALGLATDVDRAAFLGVSERTVRRARAGQLGEAFVARTVHSLRQCEDELTKRGFRPTLDNLFRIEQAA